MSESIKITQETKKLIQLTGEIDEFSRIIKLFCSGKPEVSIEDEDGEEVVIPDHDGMYQCIVNKLHGRIVNLSQEICKLKKQF